MSRILNRRRIFGSSKPQYAVTAADNPGWMDYLYHRGFTASSDYCTMEEAAAVTAWSAYQAYTAPNPIPHVDLRWFINIGSLTSGGKPITKITLPAVSELQNIATVNHFFASNINGDTYTVILPKEVNQWDPWFVNASTKKCIYIIENPIPPIMGYHFSLSSGSVDKVLGVYVPASAVDTYKTTNVTINQNFKKQYSQYADVIFPISQYSK